MCYFAVPNRVLMKFSLRQYSTGWLYPYITPTGHFLCRGLFKKVYIHQRKNVPEHTPVLLAVNHPTAFMDPCVLCTYLDPPLHNMSRGDIFRRPFFRKMLESINMFPVYRAREGYVDRDRNDEVVDSCVENLAQKRVINIFVEGMHHIEKRVMPVQKGIARIAFAAYERNQDETLQVIPVGCNYKDGDNPRDEVMVNVGTPLYIRDYWPLYQESPAKANLLLCRDIEKQLKNLCFHINNAEDLILGEQLLTLHRGDNPEAVLPVVQYHNRRFVAEKQVLDNLNTLQELEKANLRERSTQYFNALQQAGLDDNGLANPQWADARNSFMLLLLFPFFAAGYITSYPIRWFATYTAKRRVKKREFYTSALAAAGHLSGLTYYILLLIIALCIQEPIAIATALALPGLAWVSLLYLDTWKRWRDAWTASRHPQRNTLMALRTKVKAVEVREFLSSSEMR
jgi:glycerol-3-phosphate O-acyltransferase / dihydroxyacetone phosphate acyltransferase